MIKVRIHIESEEFMDVNVFVDCTLPSVPRKGEVLFITDDMSEELRKKAVKSVDIARIYAPKWFYGKSCGVDSEDVGVDNLINLIFVDAIIATNISYDANSELVHIELGKQD